METVDGGYQIAWMDVLSLFELWVTPVFAIPSQASVWIVEPTTDQFPIICPVVCVLAINRTPRKVSLLVAPLTLTRIEK